MKIKKAYIASNLHNISSLLPLLINSERDELDIKNFHIFASSEQMQRYESSLMPTSQQLTMNLDSNSFLDSENKFINSQQLTMNLDSNSFLDSENKFINNENFSNTKSLNGNFDNTKVANDNQDVYAFKNLFFDGCIIDRCDLCNLTIKKSSFTNVIFKNCNFSNGHYSDNYFYRCEFIDCKGVGADFSVSKLKDVSIASSNFSYANFSKSIIKNAELLASDFGYSYLEECNIKDVTLQKLNFSFASFYFTPLKDIDLTDCEITNITISNNLTELKGAIVTLPQAATLSKYLGIIIK